MYLKSLGQSLKKEKEAIKREYPQLLVPVLIFLTILILVLFGSQDLTANQDITFKLDPPATYNWTILDIDKLATAVALQETKYCTSPNSPTANKRNSCWGVMGKNGLKAYKTKEDGEADFKRIWTKYYGGIPTFEQAKRYSGNDKAEAWYYNVLFAYNNI